MCSNCSGMKLEQTLGAWEDKIEHLSSYADVVHTTAKQVISRRRKNENVFKMSKDEICTCKACKNTVFHCQICKFMRFLLSSSSWLLKLPIAETKSYIFRCRSRFRRRRRRGVTADELSSKVRLGNTKLLSRMISVGKWYWEIVGGFSFSVLEYGIITKNLFTECLPSEF